MGRTRRVTPGDRAIRFINNLTHTKGKFAGQTFNLRPWQESIVRQLFGTVTKAGQRQYRTALLMLPRKNGKSELAAAIALYGLLGDGEIGAEVYSAAADRDQASLVFNVAAQMVRQDPELDAICEIVDSQKRIVHRKSGSVYRAISSEAYTKHGFNASMVIGDEIHAWPGAQGRELWDVLSTSQGGREQPIMFAISTAGYDRHSLLWDLYDYATKVRDGVLDDPTFLPILYEAAKDADWLDERVWHACNPALEDFRSLEEMRIAARRAKEIPAQENVFRRLYLNQWTEQAERWIPLEKWGACLAPAPSLRGRRCYIGMDLSSTRDLTALVALFPDEDNGFDVLPAFFVPHDTMGERERSDRVPYRQWADQGWLTATSGNVVDYEAVRLQIHDWAEQFDVREIGYDPWNATDLVTRLSNVDGFSCVPLRQGFASLSAPTKALEKAIVSKALRHNGNPVLRWCVSNAAVEQDPTGNIKLSKRVSTERIDGVYALVMALGIQALQPGDQDSAYQDGHDLIVV